MCPQRRVILNMKLLECQSFFLMEMMSQVDAPSNSTILRRRAMKPCGGGKGPIVKKKKWWP